MDRAAVARQELGIRLALGASPRQLLTGVLGETGTLAALGVVIGVPLSLVAARAIRAMLFGVGTTDPWTFALVLAVLGAVAALAGFVPARRAASVDPAIVLRADGGAIKGMSRLVRGAQAVASQASTFSQIGLSIQVVLVNGNIGLMCHLPDGRLFSVIGFAIAGGKIVEMNILADPERLRLDLSAVER